MKQKDEKTFEEVEINVKFAQLVQEQELSVNVAKGEVLKTGRAVRSNMAVRSSSAKRRSLAGIRSALDAKHRVFDNARHYLIV